MLGILLFSSTLLRLIAFVSVHSIGPPVDRDSVRLWS